MQLVGYATPLYVQLAPAICDRAEAGAGSLFSVFSAHRIRRFLGIYFFYWSCAYMSLEHYGVATLGFMRFVGT